MLQGTMTTFRQLVHSFLIAEIEGLDLRDEYRVKLCSFFLVTGTVLMSLTLVYRLYHPSHPYYIFNSAASILLFVASLIYMRVTQRFEGVITLSSIIILVLMFTFIQINRNEQFGLAWSYLVPPFMILLNRTGRGLVWTGLFYGTLFVSMGLYYPLWVQEGWGTMSLVRYASTSATLVALTCMADYSFSSLYNRLHRLSITDGLIGINNRMTCERILERQVEMERRYGENRGKSLIFCIFDVDDFKQVNDIHGHPAGDQVLRRIGEILRESARSTDIVGRWGGEEFCVIMPMTGETGALAVAERIRLELKRSDFGFEKPVSCSLGLSCASGRQADKGRLIVMADRALYQAKGRGKDCAVLMGQGQEG